jgi:DNA modification methylase
MLPKPYYENNNGKLYCGDMLEIMPLLDPYDFIFTDPPYGHNNNNNGDLIHNWEKALGKEKDGCVEESRPILNDGVEANELFVKFMQLAKNGLRGGGCCCCCCCGGGPDPQFARWSLWIDEHLEFKQMVIWDKGPIGMGWHYRRSYETILVGMKKGGACKWYDTTQTVENIIRPRTGIPKIIPSKDQHPTEKPWSLAGHFIMLHTEKGDTVLDPFCGSGSTIVACERLNRKWLAIEIDESFCRMAVKNIAHERRQLKLF